MNYGGRIAPTPTGDMHGGHARTFVTAYHGAVEAGGEVVLRSEGPHYQSRRRDVFVRDAAHAPHEDDEERDPVFPPELRPAPGTGRDAGSPAGTVWRFRVPDGEAVRFTDAVRGPQTFRDLLLSTGSWRRRAVPNGVRIRDAHE